MYWEFPSTKKQKPYETINLFRILQKHDGT